MDDCQQCEALAVMGFDFKCEKHDGSAAEDHTEYIESLLPTRNQDD